MGKWDGYKEGPNGWWYDPEQTRPRGPSPRADMERRQPSPPHKSAEPPVPPRDRYDMLSNVIAGILIGIAAVALAAGVIWFIYNLRQGGCP